MMTRGAGFTPVSPHAGLRRWLPPAALGLCLAAAAACTPPLKTSPEAARGGLAGLATTPGPETGGKGAPLQTLGAGDAVSVEVYGRPELATKTNVADDGTLTVPLAGAVQVAGLSPARAGQRIAAAFREGRYLLNPQVTVSFTEEARGQQVSVLGAVKSPGRFTVGSRTTVLDVLAQAGGITEDGAGVVVLLRPDRAGKITRYAIDLKGLTQAKTAVPTLTLRGGDSLFVPPAEQFYIHGEVRAPNMYRLEPGMTVVQAISRGGGVTPRGSDSRIEIKRRRADGSYATSSAELGDTLQADDVIRVKERIF
jgi:polysaccharide biosynthesis/export protein